jgi:hypothetical protein
MILLLKRLKIVSGITEKNLLIRKLCSSSESTETVASSLSAIKNSAYALMTPQQRWEHYKIRKIQRMIDEGSREISDILDSGRLDEMYRQMNQLQDSLKINGRQLGDARELEKKMMKDILEKKLDATYEEQNQFHERMVEPLIAERRKLKKEIQELKVILSAWIALKYFLYPGTFSF